MPLNLSPDPKKTHGLVGFKAFKHLNNAPKSNRQINLMVFCLFAVHV